MQSSRKDGDTIRLLRPDGKHPDALLHVNGQSDPPAVLVVFNPGPEPASLNLVLPLGAAGIAPGERVRMNDHPEMTLDSIEVALRSRFRWGLLK